MRGGSKAVAGSEAAQRGYEAPFPPGGESRAGPRRFPWCIPFAEPEAGNAEDQERCVEALKRWTKPAHVVFGDADPVFPASWGEAWSRLIPGATFDAIPGAGHFVQEDACGRVVDIVLRRAGLARS